VRQLHYCQALDRAQLCGSCYSCALGCATCDVRMPASRTEHPSANWRAHACTSGCVPHASATACNCALSCCSNLGSLLLQLQDAFPEQAVRGGAAEPAQPAQHPASHVPPGRLRRRQAGQLKLLLKCEDSPTGQAACRRPACLHAPLRHAVACSA
jgi:hypothetical protein